MADTNYSSFRSKVDLVHEGLAALLAYRISRLHKITFTMACNDYGIVLQSPVND